MKWDGGVVDPRIEPWKSDDMGTYSLWDYAFIKMVSRTASQKSYSKSISM